MPLTRVALTLLSTLAVATAQEAFTAKDATRFARLALDCVHRPYPNKISHVLESENDARTPQQLTPVFYGCYDWHSSVHGHWLLVRLCRVFPSGEFCEEARAALQRSFTAPGVEAEVKYLDRASRRSFERPYGLAWLLQLCAELRQWDDPQAKAWSAILAPLETQAADRMRSWLPKLSHAIRTGEHSQTAFALGLTMDWARTCDDKSMEQLIIIRTRAWHLNDTQGPLRFEPSGQDFLSPCLAEADLMRRVLTAPKFSTWLRGFLPHIPEDGSAAWLPPAVVTDKTDGKLAHLDGLNLSRAWMLEGIVSALPQDDPRRPSLTAAAREHRHAGLASVTGEHYAGGHWLGSFATYLVTRRGLRP